ncbi:MAG: hypothetical protein ACI861_000848 [Paracoccaceae bacterium]|jgi:hypothetical protein
MEGFPVIRAASLIFTATLAAWPALADGFRIRTEYSTSGAWTQPTSLDAALGFQNKRSGSGSARLMWDKAAGPFRFEIHSHLSFSHGDDVAYATAIAPFITASVPATLFDLTTTFHSATNKTITNTIDRLSVTYSSGNFILKAGRQAITWGSGTVFHPNDIVAPFSPSAIDTSYKTGADMIYAQVLFDSGADLQAVAVPRSTTVNGPIDFNSSTYAVRGQFLMGQLDAALMFARDRGDSVSSLGLSGSLGGASWNAEYIDWQLADGSRQPSWLVNISNFGSLGDWNISYFAEYFHNGFGVDASVALDSFPTSLTKRMSTGQVFLPGVDFLAIGANIQVDPDLSLLPNAIISLNDYSTLLGFSANYILGDNTNLVFSYSQPLGMLGTEFGGRETSTGSGIYATSSQTATLQVVHFF